MKKKIATLFLICMTAISLTGCGTFWGELLGGVLVCKEEGCTDADIYKDGYCKYHYRLHLGEDALNEVISFFE